MLTTYASRRDARQDAPNGATFVALQDAAACTTSISGLLPHQQYRLLSGIRPAVLSAFPVEVE